MRSKLNMLKVVLVGLMLAYSSLTRGSKCETKTKTTFPSILYATKIYSILPEDQTQENAEWIGSHTDLLSTFTSASPFFPYMRAVNPDILLLRYIRLYVVCSKGAVDDHIPIGDLLEEHNEWFWRDSQGNYVHESQKQHQWLIYPYYAPRGWLDYASSAVLRIINEGGFDGVKGDLSCMTMRCMEHFYPGSAGKYSEEEFASLIESYLFELKNRLEAEGKLLILNNVSKTAQRNQNYISDVRIHHASGFLMQWFAMQGRSRPSNSYYREEIVERDMNIIDQCSNLGKYCIIAMTPQLPENVGEAQTRKDFLYCIGCYLLIRNDPYVFLNCDWEKGSPFSAMVDFFSLCGDQLEVDYGKPVGNRYKENGLWKREYTKGRVEVDLKEHTFKFIQ